MAIVIALLLFGMLAAGVFRYFSNADARRRFNKGLADNPGQSLAIYSCATLLVSFVVCVLIPPIGTIQLQFGHFSIGLWAVCGFALIGATIAMFAYGINPDQPKRRG